MTVHSHTFGRIIQLVFLNGFSEANLKPKNKFLPIFKISLLHQFLAKLIPAITNTENPMQSMNLIGEIFFI